MACDFWRETLDRSGKGGFGGTFFAATTMTLRRSSCRYFASAVDRQAWLFQVKKGGSSVQIVNFEANFDDVNAK